MINRTVLIIDDQQFMRELLQQTITNFVAELNQDNKPPSSDDNMDIAVKTFASGNSAISLLQENSEEVSLIFLDMKMEDGDGVTVLNYLAESGLSHIPVYIISSLESNFIDFVLNSISELEVRIAGFIPKESPNKLYLRLEQYKQDIFALINSQLLDEEEPSVTDAQPDIDVSIRSLAERIEQDLTLYIQPKYNLTDGYISGFEILSRLTDERLGVVKPEGFFKYIDETSNWINFDWRVVELSLVLVSKMQSQGQYFKFSINLSHQILVTSNFIVTLEELVKRHSVNLRYVTFELCDIGQQNHNQLYLNIAHLKLMGAQLALDDFGTGTSNLDCLQTIPFDEVKIDKMFITDITHSSHNQKLVASFIPYLKEQGLVITAEGVENEATISKLKELSCIQAQGYYFSIPKPIYDLEPILTEAFQHRVKKVFVGMSIQVIHSLYGTFFNDINQQLTKQLDYQYSFEESDNFDRRSDYIDHLSVKDKENIEDFVHRVKGSLKTAGIYEGIELLADYAKSGERSYLSDLAKLLQYYRKNIVHLKYIVD